MDTAQSIDIQAQFKELSEAAMTAFCGDITGMFDVEMVCRQQECCTETVAGLKKRFKNITAVVTACAKGRLEGSFHLIFDRDGLFTFGGVIVMQPKQKILENKRRGSLADVENVRDAIKEGGNLLVGSWNRVCLEKWGNKTHLLQTGTFLGEPWSKPQESIQAAENEEFLFIPCDMVIGEYPEFKCGVLFPKATTESIVRPEPEQTAKSEAVPENAAEQKPVEIEPAVVSISDKPVITENSQLPAAETAAAVPDVKVSEKPAEAVLPQVQSPVGPKISDIAPSLSEEHSEMLWTVCAKDIMRKEVVWCQSDESVEQVILKMDRNDIGYVIAGNGGMMEGIISRSDLKAAMSPYLRPMFAQWRRPLDEASLQIKVKWVMSRPVHIVNPDKPLAIVMENMCRYGVRALPVVNLQGKVEGLVTVYDVFKTLLQKNEGFLFAAKTA